MILMSEIEQLYRKFRSEDFNHRQPDTIFMSIDLFHDLLRNGKHECLTRSPLDPKTWHVLGLDVHIVENKRNFMHVTLINGI